MGKILAFLVASVFAADHDTEGKTIHPFEREDWKQSRCKYASPTTTGYVGREVSIPDRTFCTYFQAYLVISTMYKMTGPVSQEDRGTTFYRKDENEPFTDCVYTVPAGKTLSTELQEFILTPRKNFSKMPFFRELLELVIFECASS